MPRTAMEMRLHVAIWTVMAIASFHSQSVAFLYYLILPRLLGEPVLRLFRLSEHAGAELSPNLLTNTRTTYTNAVVRFLYWQMPFHAEHHLYPSVPFFALAQVNAYTAPHLATTERGVWRVQRMLIINAWHISRANRASVRRSNAAGRTP